MPPTASITGPDFGALMGRLGSAITAGSNKTLREASALAVRIEKAEIGKAIGQDMVMSGVGRRGAKIKVLEQFSPGTFPVVFIYVDGPLWFIEQDTAAHELPGRGGRPRRRRGGKRIKLPSRGQDSGIRYGPVRHPGTRGQHPFFKGQQKAEPRVLKVIRKRTFNVVKAGAKP